MARRSKAVVKREKATRAKFRRNYRAIIARAEPKHWVAAADWYAEAQGAARDIAAANGLSVERVAAILAAFSPRVQWSRNVVLASLFAAGLPVTGLSASIARAETVRDAIDPLDALTGPKVRRFGATIAGDLNAVTVDVWMMRAGGFDRDNPTVVQYRAAETVVKQLAAEHGVEPAILQALIWIVVRGRAQ